MEKKPKSKSDVLFEKATEESINEFRELISTYDGYTDLRAYILKLLDRMMLESNDPDETKEAMTELTATIIMCGMAKGVSVNDFFKNLLWPRGGERR